MIGNPEQDMIGNQVPNSGKRTFTLAGLIVACAAMCLVGQPSDALGYPQARDEGVEADGPDARTGGQPGAEPEDEKAAQKKDEKAAAKKDDHAGHPPELPNLAYAIGGLFPDTKLGKFLSNHSNWYVVRPIYSFTIVLLFVFLMRGMYRRRHILPSRFQTAMEMVVEAMDNLVCGVLGKENGRRYLPYLGSLFIYILCNNLFGLVPLGMSATAAIQCTAALAICTFLVVQYTAFSRLGPKGVVLHWLGDPKDAVAWAVGVVILLPLHIVEEFIKPLSLALRLFGNIFGEDVLLGSMLMLGIMILSFLPNAGIPLGFPLQLPFLFLATLLSSIQALVFTLLSTIYIMMVLPHGDHDEHHEDAHAHA